MKITGYNRCVKCGRVISVTTQEETEMGTVFFTENEECRFIDKRGHARNYCKECIR